ncbi:hypothetical protein HDV02_000769 [Globomyces sp. JEL0801]|nr:hypothetical protein HDV02_000769 [Globomyces sp. JEL0801]
MVYIANTARGDENQPVYTGSSRFGYLVAFAAATGGLLFGYEIGVIGQVMTLDSWIYDFDGLTRPLTKDDKGKYTHDKDAYSLLNALTTFSFLVGCAIGRRKTILVSGVLFLIGALCQSFAPIGPLLQIIFYGGRLVGGFGIGMASMCVPLYIAETAPTHIRGRLITVQQLMITIGILIASIMNAIVISVMEPVEGYLVTDFPQSNEWRYALAIQMIPALFLTIIMIFMPESPRWLAAQGENEQCLVILAKLSGLEPNHEYVQYEYKDILKTVQDEKEIGNGNWSELFSEESLKRRTIITFLIQLFQQWTGINVIFYYGPQILQNMGLSHRQAQIPGAIGNNIVNMIGTLPGMYLIEKVGRRSLLISGGIGMFLSQFLVTICLTVGNEENKILNVIALMAIASFTISFGASWGPCAWVYQSEVFPLRVRAKGTGLATFSNWFNGALVSAINPFFQSNFPNQMFLVYGCMDVLATIFAYKFVPETMGKSLEDMEYLFKDYDNMDSTISGVEVTVNKK